MIRSRRIADGTHDQWSQYSSSVPLRLVLGLDGRLRPVEAGEGPLHSTLAVNPVAQDEDEAYAALVAANRARLEELRRARYGVPDFRDHFSGGRGLALVAILAMSMIGRAAFALLLPHLYRPGSLAAVPIVLGLLAERVGQCRKRR